MAFDGSTLTALSTLSDLADQLDKLSGLSTGGSVVVGGDAAGTIEKTGDNAYSYKLDSTASAIVITPALGGVTAGSTWTIDSSESKADMKVLLEAVTVNLTTGSGNDEIDAAKANVGSVINTGAGNDEVVLGKSNNNAAYAGYVNEDGYASEDAYTIDGDNNVYANGVTVNLGTGNDVVRATTQNVVNMGEGNDQVFSAAGGRNTINLGYGDDYAQVRDGDIVTSGSGKDTVDITQMPTGVTKAASETVTLADYSFGVDVLQVTSVDGLVDKNTVADTFATNGVVYNRNAAGQLGGHAVLASEASDANYRVTVTDATDSWIDKTLNVYFGAQTSSTMDASADTAEYVYIVGNNNTTYGDSIHGSKKNDTIVAGTNDTINGGLGDDSIWLDGAATGNYIEFASTSGKDTVYNFTGGYDRETSDVVHLIDGVSKVSASVSGQDVILTSGTTSTLRLDNIAARSYWQGADQMYAVWMTNEKNDFLKTAVVTENATGVMTDGTLEVDYVLGSNSKLNAQNLTQKVVADLGNTGAYDSFANFTGINQFKGTDNAENVLIGAGGVNNTLEGGTGAANTLWGGAGTANDVLIGSTGVVDTFRYGSGNGNDTVNNFQISEDVINTYAGGAVAGYRDSLRSVITWSDGSTLTLNGTGTDTSKAIQYKVSADSQATQSLMLGMTASQNTFNYDSNVSIYYGGTAGDTLNVTTDAAKIYLDGRTGQNFTGITTINAYTGAGNYELAGSTASDTILGGTGSSSIWGGAGNVNDTLVGGSGYNTFFFGKGEGNDYVLDSNNEDKVMLYNVAEADIASAALSGENMVIGLKDGSTLTLNHYASQGAGTFELTDATYQYDKDQNVWVKQ